MISQKPLNNKNIKLFLSADLFSQFGSGMTLTALSWYAIETSGSNVIVAAFSIVNIVSGIVMSLLAGLIIDSIPKKTSAILAHLLRSVFVVVPVILLTVYGYHRLFLFIVALSNGLGWNLYFPASRSLLKEISSDESLVKSNSGAEITMQIGLFSSGAIAGTLYRLAGFRVILLISLGIFILSALLTAQIKSDKPRSSPMEKSGIVQLAKMYVAGIQYFRGNTSLLLLGVVLYVPFISSNLINVILPGYASANLHANSIVYGLIDMAYGIGAVIAGATVIGLARKLSSNVTIMLAFLLQSGLGLLLSFNTFKTIAGLLILLSGICGTAIRILMYSIVMRVVPEEALGRTLSMWNLISLIVQMVTSYIVGLIMDDLNPAWGFVLYSVVVLGGLILFVSVKKHISNPLLSSEQRTMQMD